MTTATTINDRRPIASAKGPATRVERTEPETGRQKEQRCEWDYLLQDEFRICLALMAQAWTNEDAGLQRASPMREADTMDPTTCGESSS